MFAVLVVDEVDLGVELGDGEDAGGGQDQTGRSDSPRPFHAGDQDGRDRYRCGQQKAGHPDRQGEVRPQERRLLGEP
jgi:hypothetical protein